MKPNGTLIVNGRENHWSTAMYPNQAEIFERLEVTKKYGLVSDYLVSWSGRSGRLSPKVTVWGKDGTPEDVVESYISRLLKGLVKDHQISVAAEYRPTSIVYQSSTPTAPAIPKFVHSGRKK